jgi:hypothetical protein
MTITVNKKEELLMELSDVTVFLKVKVVPQPLIKLSHQGEIKLVLD